MSEESTQAVVIPDTDDTNRPTPSTSSVTTAGAQIPGAAAPDVTPQQKRSRVKPYRLPPCKVCGGKGTGYHYGANTCTACKGFFRRALDHHASAPYQCRNDNSCPVVAGMTGIMCPACRWDKCLQVGMSLHGIKQGRYSLTRHHSNTVEVKKLQVKEASGKHKAGENKQKLMRHLVSTIVDNYDKLNGKQNEPNPVQTDTLQNFVEKRRQNEEVYGRVNPVPYTEFEQIYHGTGLQVDDRLDMWQTFTSPVEKSLKNKVKFAKGIPGFKDLCMDDQAVLLKAAYAEGWLVLRYHTFDVQHKCFAESPGREFELEKLFGEQYSFDILNVVRRLQNLQLTSEEKVMLSAFIFVTPDRPGLSDPVPVSKIQDQLLDALLWLLEQNHPSDSLVFPRLVTVLTSLRNIAEYSRSEAPRFLMKMMDDGHLKLPKILRELAAD